MDLLYKKSIAVYVGAILVSISLAKIYDKHRLKISKIKKILFYLSITIPFSLVIGFRRYDVGWDTYTYVTLFKKMYSQKYSLEFVYNNLIKFILFFTDGGNYTVFFVIIAFITIFTYLYALELYKENSPITLSLFLYYMFLGLNMADQMRQMLAMSFFMCAVAVLLKNDKKAFIIYSVIASGIHSSVIFALMVFLPVYLLGLYKNYLLDLFTIKIRTYINLYLFILFIILFVVIGNEVLLRIAVQVLPSHFNYLITRFKISTIGMGYFLDVSLIAGLVLLFNNQKKTRQENILYSYACFSFIFRFLGYYSFFLARLNHYSIIVGTLILPCFIKKQKTKKWIIILLGITYISIYYIGTNQKGNFPYYPFWQK